MCVINCTLIILNSEKAGFENGWIEKRMGTWTSYNCSNQLFCGKASLDRRLIFTFCTTKKLVNLAKGKLPLWFYLKVHFWGVCQQSKWRRSNMFSCILFPTLSRFSHIHKCRGSTWCSQQAHYVQELIWAPPTKTVSVSQESEAQWSETPTRDVQYCSV